MTKRREFTRKQRAEIINRAMNTDGRVVCEKCSVVIGNKAYEIDHVLPLSMGGASTLENAQLLCIPCHCEKSGKENGTRCKADRARDKHTRAFTRKGPPMPGSRDSKYKRKMNGEVVLR